MDIRQERDIYQWFRISVLLKGLISLAEVAAGIAILFVTPALVHQVALLLVGSQLAREPFDEVARYVLTQAYQYTSHTAKFISFYLLSRGLVKTGLVWALLKNALWAYPVSLVVMAGFVVYQCFQIYLDHSPIVLAITIFDLVVMYFIWKEWKVVEAHHGKRV